MLVKINLATFTPRAWDSLKVLQVDTTPTLFFFASAVDDGMIGEVQGASAVVRASSFIIAGG